MSTRSKSARCLTRRALLSTGTAASAAAMFLPSCAEIAMGAQAAAVAAPDWQRVKPENYPWGWIRWLMNSQVDPQAEMTLGIVQIEPKQSNPLHIHPNCTEYIYVLSGRCEHRLGDQWITLRAGAMLRIPKGALHVARTGEEACRALVVYNTGVREMVPVTEAKKPSS
jgi:quercetin dioxygenase-like cupin family protein